MNTLTEMVRERQDAGILDARDIARSILDQFKDSTTETLYTLLEETIVPAVRGVQTGQRRVVPIPVGTRRGNVGGSSSVARSKVNRIRDAWQQQLRSVLYVDGEAKRFGDCDHGDCMWLSSSLESQAADLSAKAAWYRRIADMLEGDMKVSDLPAQTGEALR